jgi:hypothetical protein
LFAATGILAAAVLGMAVAETNLWAHYLIDAGESLSLVGLAFVCAAGVYLYRRGQLSASLPLTLPWLLFPVITQGDQLIDNLSINWMRLIVHLILGALFAFPAAVVVMAARALFGRSRYGGTGLAVALLAAEMALAVRFLGELMVWTLILMIWGVLLHAALTDGEAPRYRGSERAALGILALGVVCSVGLFFGFKNRPGAYQGSPAYFMDPSPERPAFSLERVAVPPGEVKPPQDAAAVRAALNEYAAALARLLDGYYILDRNYNYDFHNRLFLRNTPLLANYREAGRRATREASQLWTAADDRGRIARALLAPDDPLAALLEDVSAYAAFTFQRAPVLERMTDGFEQTEAGLQHATHLYEGEGKVLGVRLAELLDKHARTLQSPAAAPVTSEFVTRSRAIHDRYANRIVGF